MAMSLTPEDLQVTTFETSQPALYSSASGESQCGEVCTCIDICPNATIPWSQPFC